MKAATTREPAGFTASRSRPSRTERVPGMAKTTKRGATRRSVVVSLVVNCAETLGLAVAAGVTGAVALRAQTAANAADVAVQVFLLIGGGITATAGLVLSEVTRSPAPDTVASALIGLLLLLASVLLLRTNRDLLSGRGVAPSMLREMSQVIAEQPGVVAVPDLFASRQSPSPGRPGPYDPVPLPPAASNPARPHRQPRSQTPAADSPYSWLAPAWRAWRGRA
jgi:xanthosine utilization system XapX-like protein